MVKKRKSAYSRSRSPRNLIYTLAVVFLICTGVVVGVFVFAASTLPDWDTEQLSGAKSSLIYDDQEQLAASLHAEENRTEITLDKVPHDLINAFVAIEDQDFYKHHGVNFKGILRAVVRNLQSGNMTGQGASTITQQLARNAFLTFDKQWERKLKEVILAFKLEATYSKDEIMCMYLNKIYFGGGAYGVQAASNTYFGKDASELSLPECALLAGLPQSPNAYNPFQFYDKAKSRQQMVLNSMVHCGYIDQETAAAAAATPLVFKKSTLANTRYGYYVDAVVDEALDILEQSDKYADCNDVLYKSGLRIYTGLNSEVQSYTEEIFANPANFPQEGKSVDIQAAMVMVDHSNGEIKALMGGRKYERARGFNRALSAHRQPGSSIKPLSVYCSALESGYMPFYVQDDAPISYKAGGEVWSPKNFDGKFRGPITMRTGVQHSINTYSVQMLDKIGVRKSFDFARSLGLSVTDSPGKNDLALSPLSLGGLTYGVTPVEMAGAYSAIANGGVYIKPHLIKRIVDADGAEIYSYQPHYKRVMKEQTAWLMTDLLKSVVSGGTGTAAAVPGVITAGKTGTTEKNQDAWFCGFTPGYTMTVWIGYDEKVVMRDQYGGGCPARIFRSVMSKMHEKYHPKGKGMPSGIIKVTVCSKSGKLPSEFCDQDKLVTDYCTKEAAPKETCDACQTIYICPESGKLAGKYCPNPVPFSPNLDETGKATNTAPTEQCDIHTQPQLFKSYNNTYDPKKGGEVYICTDPRHEGRVYRANIPGALQSGGCPDQYIQKVQLPPGEAIELCPLPDHQLKTKKPKEVLQEILDH